MKLICTMAASAILLLSVSLKAFAVYDDGARYTFIASAAGKSIYIVDLQERTLAHTIQIQRAPDSVAVSERLKALVIGHVAAKRLTLVDLSSADLTQIDYPLTLTPATVDVSPLGETVAIYDIEAGKLEMHAIRRHEILLSADEIHTKEDFTFSSDGSKIYWVDNASGTFNSVDLWSKKASIKLAPAHSALSAMSRSIDGTLAFVSDASADVVHIIDLLTFAPMIKVHVGSEPRRPWGTADGRYMLVPNHGDGTLTAIATLTGEAVYTVPAVDKPVSINPGWLDTTAAAVGDSGQIAFIDIDDGKVTTRHELNGVPNDGVVTSDSRTLAIPIPGNGEIAFFDMRRRTLQSQITGLATDLSQASLAISNNLCH